MRREDEEEAFVTADQWQNRTLRRHSANASRIFREGGGVLLCNSLPALPGGILLYNSLLSKHKENQLASPPRPRSHHQPSVGGRGDGRQ